MLLEEGVCYDKCPYFTFALYVLSLNLTSSQILPHLIFCFGKALINETSWSDPGYHWTIESSAALSNRNRMQDTRITLNFLIATLKSKTEISEINIFWHFIQVYQGGLPFPLPVDHVLSDLSAITCPSWVALHGMAHSVTE